MDNVYTFSIIQRSTKAKVNLMASKHAVMETLKDV